MDGKCLRLSDLNSLPCPEGGKSTENAETLEGWREGVEVVELVAVEAC